MLTLLELKSTGIASSLIAQGSFVSTYVPNFGVEVSLGGELPGTSNSEIGGRAELELGAMVSDWDSTSIRGVRNSITSDEDDSPSPPLSTTGNPKEWSLPGGLWEHRERCHLLRLGGWPGSSVEKKIPVFKVGNSMLELLSCVGTGGSNMSVESTAS